MNAGVGSVAMSTPDRPAADLRAIRAAGVAGLLFSVLLTTALVLLGLNPLSRADVEPDGSVRVNGAWLVALYLIPFAGIAFLWFMAVLRRRVGRMEDQFFATVFLGSGLLFIAMLFAADAAASSVIATAGQGDKAGTASTLALGEALSKTLFYVFAIKMAGVFMLVSSNIGRRTGVIPRWFIIVGPLAGLVMLVSVGFIEPIAVVFPAWVAILSLVLLRTAAEQWHPGGDHPAVDQATAGAPSPTTGSPPNRLAMRTFSPSTRK